MSNNTVTGVFASLPAAEEAFAALQAKGLSTTNLSILGPAPPDLSQPSPDPSPDVQPSQPALGEGEEGQKLASGLVGAVGGATAMAAGVAVGAVTGGVGLLAVGPVVAMLAAGGLGAALGGAAAAVVGQGIPARQADVYAPELRAGKTILLVDCQDSTQAADVEHFLEQVAERVSPAKEAV
jgi:hypothetical protein